MDLKDKVALITGASGGIGLAVAKKLAASGAITLLVARNKRRLQVLAETLQAKGRQAYIFPADLTSEEEREKLLTDVYSQFERIDILINSAGFGWYGNGAEMDRDTAREMLELNAGAVVHLTLPVLKKMQAQKRGHIINVSAVTGSFPTKGAALYGASKAFMDYFSAALQHELRGSGVHLNVIKPLVVRTNFYNIARRKLNKRFGPLLLKSIEPEQVADKVLTLLQRSRKTVFIPRIAAMIPAFSFLSGWITDLLNLGFFE